MPAASRLVTSATISSTITVTTSVDPVHTESVDRLGEEEIVGQRRRNPGGERRSETPQDGRGKHRGQVNHVDRRSSPARRDPQASERDSGDHRKRAGISLVLYDGIGWTARVT